MPTDGDLMFRLFSPIPGSVCFARGGYEIKGAELAGNTLIEPRTAGETIDASEEHRKLKEIAPLEANGYVIYKNGLVEFYHIPKKEIEEFKRRIGFE